MISHRCKNCLWWDDEHPAIKEIPARFGKTVLGFCRKHKPGAIKVDETYYGAQPVMDARDFCGEFRGA